MWDSIEKIRNKIAGYESSDDESLSPAKLCQRIYARNHMRKLYAERKAKGLNAHGKPFSKKYERTIAKAA